MRFFHYFTKMRTVYPSKISRWLMASMVLFLVICPMYFSIQNNDWKPILICLPIFALFLAAITGIRYEVTDSQLIVRDSWIFKEVIDIDKIKSIESSHTLLASPAASLDRLRISYNKYDEVVISPKRKKEFIEQLTSINPQISVNIK